MSQGPSPPFTPQPQRRDDTLIIVLVVVLVAVIIVGGIVGVLLYSAAIFRTSTSTTGGSGAGNPQPVTITATNYQIDYTSGGSYFGPSSQSKSTTYDSTTDNEFIDTITLTNSAIFTTHSINSITITTPGFTLVSTAPSLPYNVGPGGSVSITLTIRTPSSSYYGPLGILISTS